MVGRKPGQGQLVAIAIRPAGVLVVVGGGESIQHLEKLRTF